LVDEILEVHKKREVKMFFSGNVITFVIGVAVRFVFSTDILFHVQLEQTPWKV
jgi:hypothetical protein